MLLQRCQNKTVACTTVVLSFCQAEINQVRVDDLFSGGVVTKFDPGQCLVRQVTYMSVNGG
jgi:hypothetical protein